MSTRIVVVEDEPEIQKLIVEELEDEGYEIATANNGEEGLAVIKSFAPHLVLSDITMPVMNGHEMLQALRNEHRQMRSVPIVFLSALADRRHIIEGKKLGVDDYVTKPIDFEMLLATLEARIREVHRMTQEKEEQMLRLYKTLVSEGNESKTPPVLILTNEWLDVEPILDILNKAQLSAVRLHRGTKLDEYLDGKSYSAIIMTEQTNDLSAKLTLENSELFEEFEAPKFLFFQNENLAKDRSYWDAFTKVHSLKNAAEILSGAMAIPA